MNCWVCDAELIWGGDHEICVEDYGGNGVWFDDYLVDAHAGHHAGAGEIQKAGQEAEEHSIVTNLHCPKCKSFVLVYHGNK